MKRLRALVLEPLEPRALLSMMSAPIMTAPAPSPAPASQGLVVRLSTDRHVYHRGEPVIMTLTETNTSQQAVAVPSGPSLGGFFVARGSRALWASKTGMQPMFVQLQTLQPGESITHSATWNGQSNLGRDGAPAGRLVVSTDVRGVQPTTIQVRPH